MKPIALTLTMACLLGAANHALADNHALIMTIDYAGTPNALPGIEQDAQAAIRIAKSMGIPEGNIHQFHNQQLTLSGMSAAIRQFTNTIQKSDKVFLYYSGHGGQHMGTGGKCTESLVTNDFQHFDDAKLRDSLEALATKASQVVMFNDSCFSGGAATKDISPNAEAWVPKVYQRDGYICGQAINKDLGFRRLGVVARKNPPQIFYLAASADDEVANAGPAGSLATQAWVACLLDNQADKDGNGVVDGKELASCSQTFIAQHTKRRQTITFNGNDGLPMSFLGGDAAQSPTPVTNPAGTLESLRKAADPAIKVRLKINTPTLKINRDYLDFSVTTQQSGYLYLLHVASDGTFYVLLPNTLDADNRIDPGTYRFPRERWAIQAQGPNAGTGYLMAYLSETPKNFDKVLVTKDIFAEGKADSGTTQILGKVALTGRFGASKVAAIREVK